MLILLGPSIDFCLVVDFAESWCTPWIDSYVGISTWFFHMFRNTCSVPNWKSQSQANEGFAAAPGRISSRGRERERERMNERKGGDIERDVERVRRNIAIRARDTKGALE